jgi:hypothetical protein
LPVVMTPPLKQENKLATRRACTAHDRRKVGTLSSALFSDSFYLLPFTYLLPVEY